MEAVTKFFSTAVEEGRAIYAVDIIYLVVLSISFYIFVYVLTFFVGPFLFGPRPFGPPYLYPYGRQLNHESKRDTSLAQMSMDQSVDLISNVVNSVENLNTE